MSLLFSESPMLSVGILALLGVSIYSESNLAIGLCMVLLLFMLYFYRYCPLDIVDIPDNELISPCEGTVLDIYEKYGYYYIPIFLSPLDKHTQIYPANCKVLDRIYDHTGEFAMVMNLNKSVNNEKKIHKLMLKNGAVIQITQIAGFLPRMIASDEDLKDYKAGEYFGMIKFGSRIDLLMPIKAPDGSHLQLDIGIGQSLYIGQFIGAYR